MSRQRRWIRQALVLTASRWLSGPRRQIPTRSPPSRSWTSRPPRSQVTLRLPASSWSGTSQTATGRRSPPTSSPWTNKPSPWNRWQVTLSQTYSQTVNTGTVIDLDGDHRILGWQFDTRSKSILPPHKNQKPSHLVLHSFNRIPFRRPSTWMETVFLISQSNNVRVPSQKAAAATQHKSHRLWTTTHISFPAKGSLLSNIAY